MITVLCFSQKWDQGKTLTAGYVSDGTTWNGETSTLLAFGELHCPRHFFNSGLTVNRTI